ncbi:MAG: aspartate kinase [Bacteroidota bacterium]|nr:aspartate kinase [Bacteroidota bacterium]
MKVFKFGGASLNSVERIKSVGEILKHFSGEPLMLVMSAMGKTTNALEKVVEVFYTGDKENALNLFNVIKQSHLTTAKYLLVTTYNKTYDLLNSFFTEVEWLLHDKPVQSYDYYYDQVVCIGELLSSCIVSAYLNEKGTTNEWIDVRDIIRTDNSFREANIRWEDTIKNISRADIDTSSIYVTQGFIGSTDQNESTTLGREGSDFTAAIFANLLQAESLTIWKDVEGVMSADPKIFPAASLIPELSFNEVIEMAFYGAQVIHPKTIKPLQNKKITLQVKSFLDPSLQGTTVSDKASKHLPPVIVLKNKQALVHLQTQDFSFIGETPVIRLYELFAELNVKPNLIQTAAINLQFCVDDREEKIQQLAGWASETFDVQIEKNLTLLTIRHFNEVLLSEMLQGKDVVLTQKTKETVQALYR